MKYVFIIFGIFFANGQEKIIEKNLLLELVVSTDFSESVANQNPAIGVGIWYRYPLENNVRLELGGNFKMSTSNYQFIYGKNENLFEVNSKGYILNLGGRMVRDFTIKNQKVEWISELTFNTLTFDGKGIPDDPIKESENENSININIDAESISSLQFGQGLRIWKNNIGFGLKASFTPYRLWNKTSVPNTFNIFFVEASISIKI